jgi:hypothetical protein
VASFVFTLQHFLGGTEIKGRKWRKKEIQTTEMDIFIKGNAVYCFIFVLG